MDSEICYPRSCDYPERDVGFAIFDGESKNIPCHNPTCPDRFRIIHGEDCPLRDECDCPVSTLPSGRRRKEHKPECPCRGKCQCKPLGDHTHHTYVLLSVGYRTVPSDVEFGFRPFWGVSPKTMENCVIKRNTMYGGPITFYNIMNPDGLPTEDCLNFIIRHAVKSGVNDPPDFLPVGAVNKICVGFRFGYDVTMIFKPKPNVVLKVDVDSPKFKVQNYELTNAKCALKHEGDAEVQMRKLPNGSLFCPFCGWTTMGQLLKSIFVDEKRWTVWHFVPNEVWNEDVQVSYTPNKKLVLKHGGLRVSVDDVWGFFRGSFEGALKNWGAEWVKRGWIKEGQEIPAKIHYGKTHRAEFEKWDLQDLIEYNNLELEYGIYLMETFQANLEVCNISLCEWRRTKWGKVLKYKMHGSGAIAGFFLDTWGAKKHHWGGGAGEITEIFESASEWTVMRKGAVSRKICKHCDFETFKQPLENCPHPDHRITWELGAADGARRNAYYGARIELFKRGRFPHKCRVENHNNTIWHGDLISAYPSAMQYLPSIHTKWDTIDNPTIADLEIEPIQIPFRYLDEKVLEKLKFGCVAVEWFLPLGTIMGPFPVREDTGHVRFPPQSSGGKPCRGKYHVIEVWTVMQAWARLKGWRLDKRGSEVSCTENGVKYYIRMTRAWLLRPPYTYPLRQPVREIFEQRRKFKDAHNAAEKVLKLGLNCFSEDTEIITTQGIKNIKEIKVGDKVISVNPQTLQTEIVSVTKTWKYRYKGQMIHFKNRNQVDLLVTPNHKMLVAEDSHGILMDASDVVKQQEAKIPALKLNMSGEDSNIKIGSYEFKLSDFAEFLGWFISEGHIYQQMRNGKKNGLQLRITQYGGKSNLNGKQYRDEIRQLLIRMGLRFSETYDKIFNIYNPDLWHYLEMECYTQKPTNSHSKKIPRVILDANPFIQFKFFNAAMKGDGNLPKYRQVARYSTVSKQLALDITQIIANLGYFVRYELEQGNHPIYRVFYYNHPKTLQDDDPRRVNRYWKEEFYDGYVYCLSVSKNETVFAGRNHCFVACGRSLFGRQAIRPTKRNKCPQSRELFFAGFDTAYARAQLLWYSKPHEDAIIAFQTDGIYSLEPLDVPEGKNLGQFEVQRHDRGVFILAGVYGITIDHDELKESLCECRTSMWGELHDKWGNPICTQPCTEACRCDDSCLCHWSYRIRGYADLDVRHMYDERSTPHHPDCPSEPHSICEILRKARKSRENSLDLWDKDNPVLDLGDERFIPIRLGLATMRANRLGEFMDNPRTLDWDANQKRFFIGRLCDDYPFSSDSTAQTSQREDSMPYKDRIMNEDEGDLEDEADILSAEYTNI